MGCRRRRGRSSGRPAAARGINSCPAIVDDLLLVGAGAPPRTRDLERSSLGIGVERCCNRKCTAFVRYAAAPGGSRHTHDIEQNVETASGERALRARDRDRVVRTSRRSYTERRTRSISSSPRSRPAATSSSRTSRDRKTILARALAGSIEGATACLRIQCTPDLQPTDVTGLSVFDQRVREFEFSPRPGLRQRAARRRDQSCDAQDAVGTPRGDGRAPGDRRRSDARGARRRSSSWRRRTRSSRRARSRSPRRSSTASFSRPSSATRVPTRSSTSSAASGKSIPSTDSLPSSRSTTSASSQHAIEDVYVDA